MILHDDLPESINEHFDRLLRDPDEFRRWVGLVLGRCVTSALRREAGEAIASALFVFVTNVLEAEDEDMVALDRLLDGAVTELREHGLTTGMLRKSNGRGYDVRCFWDYCGQRAVEDASLTSIEGPEHPATGVTA